MGMFGMLARGPQQSMSGGYRARSGARKKPKKSPKESRNLIRAMGF